jgi:Glycosyl hydrolase family 47
MEYKYLAHLTGRTEYFDKVEHVMTLMQGAHTTNGLLPTAWNITSGLPLNGTLQLKYYSYSTLHRDIRSLHGWGIRRQCLRISTEAVSPYQQNRDQGERPM